MTKTVRANKRGVPIEIDYDDETGGYPELRSIYVGDVKVWPLHDAASFIVWVRDAADAMLQADMEERIQYEQDEEADRKREA